MFVDTNLFVLLLVGSVNKNRIRDFKRTQDFTIEDFIMLSALVDWFGVSLVTTPHVLSQVSDLTDLSGREAIIVRKIFKSTIEAAREMYDTAKHLIQNPLFERFGLGDASVGAVCAREVVVLTADVQLQLALAGSGLDAINFNHVRARGWRHPGA